MGYIVTAGDFSGQALDEDELPFYLELRRESFILYTDFGEQSIELPYEQLPILRLYVDYLEQRRQEEDSEG